jgi:two-component system, cell cycle sensor histidine kinase and response regulator CckA
MEQFLRRLIGTQVDLAVTIPQGMLPVTADPSQIQQVIINLATNARDAMPSGGQLTIQAGSFDKVEGGPGPVLPVGPYVTLVVKDTGIGMDAETRRLAFHPFFTTKELGQGTGLGLATVYGIVDQSGGFIFVESQPAQGSAFSVYLPRVTGAAAAQIVIAAPPVPLVAAEPRRATVLLAEDNPMVRDVAARILRDAGHTLLLACDGQEGLEVARDHAGTIDLLVTDLVMGRMGGIELAKRLAEQRPELRILFISGFAWDNSLPAIDPARGIDFLQKPFAPDGLIEAVTRLLAAPLRRRSEGSGPTRQPDTAS